MADSEADGLTAEERANAESGLLKAVDEFMKQQSEGASASNNDQEESNDEDATFEPDRKKRRTKRATKKAAKKDIVFDAKVAVCKEVRKHPELYQITHKGYQDKHLKDSIWENVSEAVKSCINKPISVDECKKLWTALKESTR